MTPVSYLVPLTESVPLSLPQTTWALYRTLRLTRNDTVYLSIMSMLTDGTQVEDRKYENTLGKVNSYLCRTQTEDWFSCVVSTTPYVLTNFYNILDRTTSEKERERLK